MWWHFPRGVLNSGEKLVLLALAEECRDERSRRVSMTLEDLGDKCDMSAAGVSKALQRLAGHGIELRLPLRTDGRVRTGKDGRVLYALPGQAMTFVLPDFPPPPGCECTPCRKARQPSALDEPEGQTTVRPSEGKGGQPSGVGRTTVPSRADSGPFKGGPLSAPTGSSGSSGKEPGGGARTPAREPAAAVVVPLRNDPPAPVIDGEIVTAAPRYPRCPRHAHIVDDAKVPNCHGCAALIAEHRRRPAARSMADTLHEQHAAFDDWLAANGGRLPSFRAGARPAAGGRRREDDDW